MRAAEVCMQLSQNERNVRERRDEKRSSKADWHIIIQGCRQNGRYGGEEVTGSRGLKVAGRMETCERKVQVSSRHRSSVSWCHTTSSGG